MKIGDKIPYIIIVVFVLAVLVSATTIITDNYISTTNITFNDSLIFSLGGEGVGLFDDNDFIIGDDGLTNDVFRFRYDQGSLIIDTDLLDLDSQSLNIKCGNVSANACFNVQRLPLSTDLETGKAFQFLVEGDVKARGMFYSDGSYFIGDGTSDRDIGILRVSANTLQIASDKSGGAGNLNVTGNYTHGADVGISGNYTNGDCWTAYSGGIVYATNCSSA